MTIKSTSTASVSGKFPIIILTDSRNYELYCTFNKHSSYITALDWSLDDEMIRSCCGAYELLFFNVQTKEQDTSGASNTVRTEWANHSVKFGWRVDGIYPAGTDVTFVNSVEESKDKCLIATGDDFGMINIYRNPCR